MSEANRTVDLFTSEEQRVLDAWFRADTYAYPYTQDGATVADIMLESVEGELPQWSVVSKERGVEFAREYRDQDSIPDRQVVLRPQHLMAINWADSGPGYSWPAAYYATWVPIYDCFVVTVSFDTDEIFSDADFALGWFAADVPIVDGARELIVAEWRERKDMGDQPPWEYLFENGLVPAGLPEAWRDEVWPDEEAGCGD